MRSTDPPSFDVTPPVRAAGPFVFASPHSGDIYPAELQTAATLDPHRLRSAEDVAVDRLIAEGPVCGAPVIRARLGRAYVDLNRDAEDLDPALIDGCDAVRPSAKALAGYGVIARLSGDGQALYDRRLSREEAEARLARAHAPYHAALAELMHEARRTHGVALLIDWHSMPSRAAGARVGSVRERAVRGLDVVLGDRHGAACRAGLTRRLAGLFEAAGWRVGLNHPYAGGYCTQSWGRPPEGFEAVQVELNRSLYLDETTLEPGAGFDRTRRIVSGVIKALLSERWMR